MEHVKYTVTTKTRSACLYEADSAQQLAILGPQHCLIVTTGL